MVCLREPARIELRPTLEEILDRLNEVQTQSLIQELVADKPELIRLQILERQERFEEYLYLAEAEGQTIKYLTMLARLARVSQAMEASQSQMSTMEQALALSQALVNEQNAQPEALTIAKRGLNLPGRCQYDLATWTSEIALELDDLVTATTAKVKAFQAQPSFADYHRVELLLKKID